VVVDGSVKRGALIKTQSIILQAAGRLVLASGLCILSASAGMAAQATKPETTSSAHSTSTNQAKKPTAVVKPVSISKTGKKKPSSSRTVRARMQTAPTADRIREIQAALAEADSYKGQPSGKWDDASINALKHFQQVNGLNPTGKLDAHSLQKLGLGSETAGRGAPRPGKQVSPATSSTTPAVQR
jgi:murein L,D-transpeptidase YcbB/YkuD